ncbi:hypothetical protein [uncultured Roseibium sp.]|uniref:hypothetical protein n=1 Tax=uncultured Roseibium sp. TaxID=1936171 RepID=UPI0032170EC1
MFESDAPITTEQLRRHPFIRRGYWRAADEKRLLLGPVEATVHQIEPQLMLVPHPGTISASCPEHLAQRWVEEGKLVAILPEDISYTCTFSLILRKWLPADGNPAHLHPGFHRRPRSGGLKLRPECVAVSASGIANNSSLLEHPTCR